MINYIITIFSYYIKGEYEMDYTIVRNRHYYEVLDMDGNFVSSEDSYSDALITIEELRGVSKDGSTQCSKDRS